jgi:signal transduction histidine kinase
MITPAVSSLQSTGTDFICVATDLLCKMISERDSMELHNRRVTLAMATVGHDLRQRLHALLGTVDLLSSAKDEARAAELNQRAKSLIFRLAREAEQMAIHAEREDRFATLSPKCFEIGGLLKQLEYDWMPLAAKKCLRFTIDCPNYLVESDPYLLASILDNVVGNAVRHTPSGSVTVSSMIEDCCVALAVSDTGPGISHDDLYRSFGVGCAAGSKSEGMGIGLNLARRSAEALGHELQVSSPLRGGTCIRLNVPLATEVNV